MANTTLHQPDVLNQLADRIQRAEHQARHVLDEMRAMKTLFRLVNPDAARIAEDVFLVTPRVQDEEGGS